MKSVDALRKWSDGLRCVWIDPNDHSIFVTTCDDMPPSIDCVNLREHVNAILDGIEREVEELRDRDYRNGREDAEGAVEFADRLKAAVDRRADVTLFGVDYMAYPIDADGVPIHIGDVMEWLYGNGEFRVNGIGGNTLFYIDKDSGECEWTAAGDKRHHHHAPTVEDVLREFVERLDEIGSEDDCGGVDEQECRACIRRDIAAAYAEYAAKLRLAGDE